MEMLEVEKNMVAGHQLPEDRVPIKGKQPDK
jgi:hypothetical protein